MPRLAAVVLLLAMLVPVAAAAQDAVVRIEERQFRPGAGRITFSEVPPKTPNPVYPPARYGGAADSPTVRFGGNFLGRQIAPRGECPAGAAPTGCLSGSPAAPLGLDPRAPAAITEPHETFPGFHLASPTLVGTPPWLGPIAILFDRDVAAVGLYGVAFDATRGVAISVYDREARLLGRIVNQRRGIDFMGVATRDLSARIAGLEFHLVGSEPWGFGVDNIRFAAPAQIDLPGVVPPAPAPPAAPPPPAAPRRPVILP